MKTLISICALVVATGAMPLHAQEPAVGAKARYLKLQEDSELRMALAKVSLYSETNQKSKAFALMDELNEKYPNNTEVMMAAADLNMRVDNQGSAYKYINNAHKLDPLNEDILERRNSVLQERRPFVLLGGGIKHSNQSDEQTVTAGVRVFVMPTVSASIIAENNNVKSKDAVIRANGEAQKFDDSIQRATLSLSKLFDNGDGADAFVNAGNQSVGGGAEYTISDRYGSTSLRASYAKPEWDFIETQVGNGTKDSVYIVRKQHIVNNLEAVIGGGVGRYNLEDDSSVAKSKGFDFNLAYSYPYQFSQEVGDQVNLGLAYNVGAEYFFDRKEKINSNGDVFYPFPAASYEVHSLTASVSKSIIPNLSVDGFAGYAVDRFGSKGPIFGAGATYSPANNLSIEVLGSRSIIGENVSGKVDQFNINLKIHW